MDSKGSSTSTDLTKGKLLNHLKNIAIPASIGYLFNTLFNVIDTFWAGKLSTEALSGLTVSFPIFFIIIALSVGIGRGTTALMSIALGSKNKKEFNIYAYNAFGIAIITSIILILSSKFIVPILFDLTGSAGKAKDLGVMYTETIFFGAIFFSLNYIFNAILTAQGNTKPFRNFLIIGFFINLILDPILIFGWIGIPKLGTVGIALATVIVQFIGTIYLYKKIIKSETFTLKYFEIDVFELKKMKELLEQSIPATLSMSTIALGVFVINYFVLSFAGDSTIAGYGVGVRVEQLVLLPVLGINVAVLSVVGQNYGGKKFSRIKEMSKLAKKMSAFLMVIGGFIIYPLAEILVKLFNSNPAVIEAGSTYLRIEILTLPAYALINNVISSMQGIKKPNIAVYIGFYRQILMPLIVFNLLGNVLGLEVLGVWWGIVIINWS
ncbi:MAG: MATE family efflux transporter, partial [Bacillota bacterium]